MIPSKVAKKMAKVFLNHSKSLDDALLIVDEVENIRGLGGNVKAAIRDVKPFLYKEGKVVNGREGDS